MRDALIEQEDTPRTITYGASKKGSGDGPTGMEAVYKREPGLRTTLAQIEKQFGEGSIMPLGGEALLKISGVQTGSLSLDMALGGIGKNVRVPKLITARYG